MTSHWENDPLLARCTIQWLAPAARQPEYWRAWFVAKRFGFLDGARRILVNGARRSIARVAVDLHAGGVGEAVTAILGLHGPHYCYPDWMGMARALEDRGDRIAALYCRINDWASLDFCPHVAGSGGWRGAWSRWEGRQFCRPIGVAEVAALVPTEASRVRQLARSLMRLGHPGEAGAMLTGWIEGPGGGLCEDVARLRILRAEALSAAVPISLAQEG